MEKARLLFIDNVRILLITLVILLHLSVTYGGVGGWYYKEGRPDAISFIVLTWINATSQAFGPMNLQFPFFPQYICLFFIGIIAYRRNWLMRIPDAMSASAYTAYIIHAPVVVLFALAIRNITLHPLLKFAIASLICVPSCFALGNVFRKLPWARRIL